MPLPTSYLTSVKNLTGILNAIQSAQAPEKFTYSFLGSLEYKSSSDRLISGLLKSLGFLDDGGRPTDRYFRYLDQTQSARVLAEGIKEAYADLFQININAQKLTKKEIINKFKTLSQGKISDSVLDKMAMTFTNIVKHADFAALPDDEKPEGKANDGEGSKDVLKDVEERLPTGLGGLVYNIQIVLPESRDPAVYDALFQALRKHLP
ncbi:MAG: DUF5343 domain-containing protein [Candidatus Marinimicrobia bacterium]|nr:DUF5343 domain-containing protein [Candidatus Neomarinimicrobiota bacterium]